MQPNESSVYVLSVEQMQGRDDIGSKAHNLWRCHDAGYSVPAFVVIPASVMRTVYDDEMVRSICVDDAVRMIDHLHHGQEPLSYAVRSSALCEDQHDSAMAGQFTTCLDVGTDALADAICSVATDAFGKIRDLSQFAIIIQVYYEPVFAGVTFTRDPAGSTAMCIEYVEGASDLLVGGHVNATTIRLLQSEYAIDDHMPLVLQRLDAKKMWQSIEALYDSPQDIERCVANNTLWVLQTRPITTITDTQYRTMKSIDAMLVDKETYCYKKTTLCEMTPRPVPFTYSLLCLLYAQGGPIDRAYRSYGITYTSQDVLVLLGNELYVDTLVELQTLLPAYYRVGPADQDSRFAWGRPQHRWTTLRNTLSLQMIPIRGYSSHAVQLRAILHEGAEKYRAGDSDLDEILTYTLSVYETIFAINLCATAVYKKLASLLGLRSPVSVADIIAAPDAIMCYDTDQDRYVPLVADHAFFVGNSIDIADTTPFVAHVSIGGTNAGRTTPSNNSCAQRREQLPGYRKRMLYPIIESVIAYTHVREAARRATVMCASMVRDCLADRPSCMRYTIDELRHMSIDTADSNICQEREACYNSASSYTGSPIVSSWSCIEMDRADATHTMYGVSPGCAQGHLCGIDMIDAYDDVILCVDVLSPDLTSYFDRIKGIVSTSGSLLSHLAIMAREHGIPVVVGWTPKSGVRQGDRVMIDGAQGTLHSCDEIL